jgi:hypothetical protein
MVRFLLASVLSALAMPAAAECTPVLREGWSATFAELLEFHRQFSRARNMHEAYDRKALCRAAAAIPAVAEAARIYYPACDPLAGDHDIAELERLDALALRFAEARCQAGRQASETKAPSRNPLPASHRSASRIRR